MFLHGLDHLHRGCGSQDPRRFDHVALGKSREREDLTHTESVTELEDPMRDLVLALGADPLVIPS